MHTICTLTVRMFYQAYNAVRDATNYIKKLYLYYDESGYEFFIMHY